MVDQDSTAWALLTFGAGQFFAVGACPGHCSMFGNILGAYPLDASSTARTPSLSCDIPKGSLQTVPNVPGVGVGAKLPMVETHCLY